MHQVLPRPQVREPTLLIGGDGSHERHHQHGGCLVEAFDQAPVGGLEIPERRGRLPGDRLPGVVDADENAHQVRVLGQHVALEARLQVRHAVAADTRIDHPCEGEGSLRQLGHVTSAQGAARPILPCVRDGVSGEHDGGGVRVHFSSFGNGVATGFHYAIVTRNHHKKSRGQAVTCLLAAVRKGQRFHSLAKTV